MDYRQTHKGMQFRVRNTTKADIAKVIKLEQSPQNAPYIDQWNVQQHTTALNDLNIAHWVLEGVTKEAPALLGYVILVGLQDSDNALHFRRIVIAEKRAGLGRATVQYIKDFAFHQNRSHRLWLNVKEGNNAAHALYLSEGFVEEGLARDAAKVGEGKYASHIVMSMLEGEHL